MNPLLTTEDIAEFFRMDVVTIRRMIGKGELPAYRIGSEYRFKQADIDEYLERQRVPIGSDGGERVGTLVQQVRDLVTSQQKSGGFQHFTKRVHSVLALAQEEAHRLDHAYLGTEHILLGLLREGEGMGAQLLVASGCNLETIRHAIQDIVGPGPGVKTGQHEMCVTPRFKKVMELAVDEASRFNHAYLGTEHLALALLREGEGVAGRLLKERGMDLSSARHRVEEMLTK